MASLTDYDPGDDDESAEEITDSLIFVPRSQLRRIYTCPECGDQYINPAALGAHVREDHKESQP